MKRCIINLGTKGWYPQGQARLKSSLDEFNFKGDLLTWGYEEEVGAPKHSQIPYAFKTYCFMRAKELSYDSVLWLDSSMWAIQSLEPVFDAIESQGHLCVDSGWQLGQWCSDVAKEQFNLSREQMMNIKMISSGLVGLNLNNPKANDFLNQWHEFSKTGITFKGAWTNNNKEISSDEGVFGHRHDQTVASYLINKLDLEIQPGNTYFTYAEYYEELANKEQVYFLAQGM